MSVGVLLKWRDAHAEEELVLVIVLVLARSCWRWS